ncbi:MAG TPA: AroM family protein, partial [Chloroflexota bacterium]|nr:AroM family protein [Chloroflexota bacterium]
EIGQSPRVDVIPEIQAIVDPDVEFVEGGALDGLSRAEIAELAPKQGDYVLVTRLQDGSSVQVAEHHILPRMQGQIDRVLAAGVEVVALLCTGEFPPFQSSKLLIKPQPVLHHFVTAVAEGKRLGVVIPAQEQVEQAIIRWKSAAADVRVEAGSPYEDISQLERAAEALKRWEADIIVLDCMGFTTAAKARAAAIARVPVVLPRSVLARTLAELI